MRVHESFEHSPRTTGRLVDEPSGDIESDLRAVQNAEQRKGRSCLVVQGIVALDKTPQRRGEARAYASIA
jgi:hypothetical protein